MRKALLVVAAGLAAVALGQGQVDDWRTPIIVQHQARYTSLRDGGAVLVGCVRAFTADGGAERGDCTDAPLVGRTAAERNRFASCAEDGKRLWMRDNVKLTDGGF